MNYIKEINGFYDWLETNPLSKSAIALWNALMHINNKADWRDRFTVATSVLEYKTGFKKSELFKARNELKQKNRILWSERGGNLSAEYTIISFCVHNTDANGNANGNANGTQMVTQTVTINKLNKTKQNKTSDSKESGESSKKSDDQKFNEERKKVSEQKKKEEHWAKLVSVWFEFYESKSNPKTKPTFEAKEQAALKKILEKLRGLASKNEISKNQDWTEVYAVKVFTHFLIKAYSDKWRSENFMLHILNSHFDAIIQTDERSKQTTNNTKSELNADYKRKLAERAAKHFGES